MVSEHGGVTEHVREVIFDDLGVPGGSKKEPKSGPGAVRKRSEQKERFWDAILDGPQKWGRHERRRPTPSGAVRRDVRAR